MRLIFLDCLRGLAVLLVMFSHFSSNTSKLLETINVNYFQIGQCGVNLFFLISGYIIPRSINHTPNLKQFWVHRIFRLYPIYWVCIFIGVVLTSFGHRQFPINTDNTTIAINLSMMQGFFNTPNIIGVFWSLKFELAFYILISGLFFAKLIAHSYKVFLTYSIFILFSALIYNYQFDKFFPYGLFHIEIMLLGWVLSDWHSGKYQTTHAAYACGITIALALVTALTAFSGRIDTTGTLSVVPMFTAWLLSIVIFLSALCASNSKHWPPALAWIGVGSYSAYLFHTTIQNLLLNFFDSRNWHLILLMFGVTFFVSWISYRLIEKPSISIGKYICRSNGYPSRLLRLN